MASILHMHRTPSNGGDTLWANMYDAYEALSQPMRDFLEPLTAFHAMNYTGYYGEHKPQREKPTSRTSCHPGSSCYQTTCALCE